MTAQAPTVAEAARLAWAAGLNVLPPKEDGSKAPDARTWTRYQTERTTEAELEGWYGSHTGIGVVCGLVSGGLEMFEFEGRAVADGITREFRAAAVAAGLGPLLDRVMTGYLERTPSGGFHLLYRCPTPAGSTKLASRPGADGRSEVFIETKAEGGYAIVAPSNGRVHPSGGAWTLEAGGFDTIATITDAERDALHALARTFDRMPAPPPRQQRAGSADEERASDRWARRPDIDEIVLGILVDHRWTHVHTRGDGVHLLRRPGKDHGISATLGHDGPGVLHVFSTSTEFEAERGHSAFTVYGTLVHGRDWKAAGRALWEAEGPHGPTLTGSAPGDGPEADVEEEEDGLAPASELTAPAGLDDWLIEGIVRPGDMLLVASSEGLGKSVLRREMSIRAATGQGAVLGLFTVPQAVDVLVLDLENGPAEEWRQEETVLARMGIERAALGRLVRGTVDVHLVEPEGLARLRGILARHRPALLMLDTGTAAVDEEYGRELKAAIRNLTALLREHGCAAVLFVHVTKPPREGRRPPVRGLFDVMGNWPRRAAGVVVLSDLGDDRVLFQTFKRIPRRRLVLTRDAGLWAVLSDLGDSGGTTLKTGPKRTTRDRIIEAIAGGLVVASDVADYVGCAPKTVWNHVTKLRSEGRLTGAEGAWELAGDLDDDDD